MSLAESLDLAGALQKGMGQFTIMDLAIIKLKRNIILDLVIQKKCFLLMPLLENTEYLRKHFFLVFRKFPC